MLGQRRLGLWVCSGSDKGESADQPDPWGQAEPTSVSFRWLPPSTHRAGGRRKPPSAGSSWPSAVRAPQSQAATAPARAEEWQ